MRNPYGRTVRDVFGEIRGTRWMLFPALAVLREVVLYLTTPLRLLAHELRRENCDVILCQEYEYPRFDACVLLGRLMRLPVFATFQGGDYQRSRLERLLRPLTLRASAGLIIATQSEVRRVRARYGIPPAKVARIFNPVDLEVWSCADRSEARAELGISLDARVAVWHGRVSMWRKGLDILLEAWERVCSQRPAKDLRLLLVGTGKDAEELRQIVEFIRAGGLEAARARSKQEIEEERRQLRNEQLAAARGTGPLARMRALDDDRASGVSAAGGLLKFLLD